MRRARDYQVAKEASIEQEKKDKVIKKKEDEAKRIAKKAEEDTQKKLRKEERQNYG
jgi:hypothetical protein